MRHTLRSAVTCLVSALLVAGLMTVAPANSHAATGAKGVWAWGDNTYGLVGDGTTKQRVRPVRVQGLADVSSMTHYANAAYAVEADGTVWRWGSFYQPNPNDPGGDGTDVIFKTPTMVAGLSGVKAIAVEQYNGYAVRSDGTVWGWEYLNAPAPVAGLSDVASISPDMSGDGGYALKRDGTVWEFHGDRYSTGAGVAELGGVDNVSSLTSGSYDDGADTERSWYAIKSDGTVWAWGDNRKGQLGDGTETERAAPVPVSGLTGVAKVTAGAGAAYAVTTAGAVWAWGANEGQLGDGTKTDRATPVRLTVLSQVAEVIPPAGAEATWYARTTGGLVYYWGCGWPSHYGDAAEIYQRCGKVPLKLPGLTGVRKVVAYDVDGGGDPSSFDDSGSGGGYAIKNDGSLWVWGGHGGTLSNAWAPVRVSGLSGVTAVFPYNAGAYAIGTQVTKAWVRTPVAPSVMYASRARTVYGYLKPKHTAGTYPVRIYKYRYVSGRWRSYGYVKAKAYNYSTYTKYSASVKLPYRGRWRLRAYHPADAGHAGSWSSGYAYVTVR